ncbi:hypothetical protein BH09BAC5_BH09BAC5_04930 [soil metagenome]
MADKKKIKGIKDGTGTEMNGIITVGDVNPPKAGVAAGPDEIFTQYGYKALCFNVDDVINTDSIVDVAGKSSIVQARRIQRGTVTSVNASNDSGTISENKTGKTINFHQSFCAELSIIVKAEVKYDLVYDFASGGEMAVNVEMLP